MKDDLSALIFEIQRAGSPAEKARALARGWRTIRELDAVHRRLLVREVGFDGAEDLIEGLAGRSGGSFAPAAVLEALEKMRRDKRLSVRKILADLKDPERRDDLLARGLDLAAGTFASAESEVEEAPVFDEPVAEDIPTAEAVAGAEIGIREPEAKGIPEIPPPGSTRATEKKRPSTPHSPRAEESARTEEDPAIESTPPPEEPDSSLWDADWRNPREAEEEPRARWSRSATAALETVEPHIASGTVLERIRELRRAIPQLRTASPREIQRALDNLPELWARRRAAVALIEAGVPEEVGDALDLIEDFDRPLDRSWCLAALARRGGLEGDDLERALEMLASPAARRRVELLASLAR